MRANCLVPFRYCAFVFLVALGSAASVQSAVVMQSNLLEQRPLSGGIAEQGLALSANFYYGATATTLYEFDASWNFIRSAPISLPGVNHMGAIHYSSADGHIWAGFLDSNGSGTSIVARINPSTLSVVQFWDISGNVEWIDPVFFDGTHVWVGELSNLGIHRYRLDAGQLVHDGVLRYPANMSFSQGIRIRDGKLYSIHTFGSADGLFEFDLPAQITDTFVEPTRVWPIQETVLHLEGFDFIPGEANQIWHAQASQVDRYELTDTPLDPNAPPAISTGCPDSSKLVVVHNWLDLLNAGTSGPVNNAVLVFNGANATVGGGLATVVNGGTPGPGVPFGSDDGYISLGTIAQFQGATYFELSWRQLDLNEAASSTHVLCGALAPGFSSGSQTIISATGVSPGALAEISVTLYESGGAFGGGDPNEVVGDTILNNVLPVTPADLKLVYKGNGLTRAQGGLGTVSAYVNGALVDEQSIDIGIVNPTEFGAAFGLGKYHNASTVAGAYTTGPFSVSFAPILSPTDYVGSLDCWGPLRTAVGCECFDFDADNDLDLSDFAVLQPRLKPD